MRKLQLRIVHRPTDPYEHGVEIKRWWGWTTLKGFHTKKAAMEFCEQYQGGEIVKRFGQSLGVVVEEYTKG